MRRKILVLSFFIAANFAALSQAPSIVWEKCLGGISNDYAQFINQTSDGGFIAAGITSSNDGDVSGWHYGYDYNGLPTYDYWIVKLNADGNKVWQKCLGGSNDDEPSSIQQTSDGGFIIAGESYSDDGDISGHHGNTSSNDYWIVKLDAGGNLAWQKSFGGSGNDWGRSIQQTTDGGFIIAGSSSSNDGDVSGNHGGEDYWIVKIDAVGNLMWQKSFGGSTEDVAFSIQLTLDAGFIVAGLSRSNDGDVSGNHGSSDYWILKLDSNGNFLWQKSLGGNALDNAYSIQQTADLGFIVAGTTWSNDGDVSGNHGLYDYWVVKLDAMGNLLWQKTLGGSGYDYGYSIQQTSDGGFITAGTAESNDDEVTGNHNDNFGVIGDYWIVKLDIVGNILWQKCFGGNDYDAAWCVQQTTDDGFIIGGSSFSNEVDVSGNHGEYDFWIVKLSPDVTGVSNPSVNSLVAIFPNPGTGVFEIQKISSPIQTAEAFNLIGEKVFSTSTLQHSNSIDLSSHPDGVYFLQLKTDEGMVVKKVIISR